MNYFVLNYKEVFYFNFDVITRMKLQMMKILVY